MSRLSSDELGELVDLHLRVGEHLTQVRSFGHDPNLSAHLSMLVARSSAVVHGSSQRSLRAVWTTLLVGFPAAVWHSRRAIVVATALFILGAFAVGLWVATSDAALSAVGPGHLVDDYVEHAFIEYYSSEPAPTFATRVFTNNAAVAALAWISGIVFGLPTMAILLLNGANVGVAGGLFHAVGDPNIFWGLILPHGLLELSGVFVAAGAGLQLGWAVIAPGDRPRRVALANEGRRSVVIVLGLIVVFAIAGVLEAFVTPASWPTGARIGVGAVVWLAVSLWVILVGRRASAKGHTTELGHAAVLDHTAMLTRTGGSGDRNALGHVGA